ncbi:MFS transporter [Thermocrispum municipale]|uniref:MFS transporter n=1 Tax=Thermocrispum municipale TaxID=37926 RepID=UPI000409CA04|nr:MFS transporter [Thermocrispum municipale]
MRRTERKQTTIPRFSRVVANREFRGLWLAEALSIAGDQLAKVALAILVYQRTASPLWSAVVYAMTFLPALFGGLGLSQLADRFPRRTLLIWCILAQAALVGIMVIPGMPLPVLCALVFFVAMLSAPTNAAQNATAREAFDDDAEYLRSQDLRGITTNTMMLLGLAGGGLLVTAVGVPWALAIDAATFVLAAVIIHLTVRWRPAAGSPEDGWFAGARITASDPHLRVLFAMALLVGLTVVPEGLAAPIAAQMDEPDVAVGWLLAADPLGFVIGAFVFSHYASPATRLRLMGPLAVISSAALLGFAVQPPLVVALLLLAASGASGAYILTVAATVNSSVANNVRGSVMGLFRTALRVTQGLGVALGGVVATAIGSATGTVALAGALGVLAATAVAVAWARQRVRPGAVKVAADVG